MEVKAKARIWPGLSYVCRRRSTAVGIDQSQPRVATGYEDRASIKLILDSSRMDLTTTMRHGPHNLYLAPVPPFLSCHSGSEQMWRFSCSPSACLLDTFRSHTGYGAPGTRGPPHGSRGRTSPLFSGSAFRVSGFGFRGSDCGFQVSDSGFGVWGLGFRVSDSGFQVSDFRFRVSGFGFRVSGFGIRVSGFGSRVSDFGFRVSGCGLRLSAFGIHALFVAFKVSGFICRVSGSGFEIPGFVCRV